jgi:hypothetical protein
LALAVPLSRFTSQVGGGSAFYVRRMSAALTSFAIGFVDTKPTDDGHAMGFIQIGDFSERFVVTLNHWDAATYSRHWHEALRRLLTGSPAVGLMTWMTPPRSRDAARAWILYRDGEQVFIQERIFVSPEHRARFDEHQQLVDIAGRQTVNADGDRISEWSTGLRSIQDFLSHESYA